MPLVIQCHSFANIDFQWRQTDGYILCKSIHRTWIFMETLTDGHSDRRTHRQKDTLTDGHSDR